jgi:hypothetical protein
MEWKSGNKQELTETGETFADAVSDRLVADIKKVIAQARGDGMEQAAGAVSQATGMTREQALESLYQSKWYKMAQDELRPRLGSATDLYIDFLAAHSAANNPTENIRRAQDAVDEFSRGLYEEAVATRNPELLRGFLKKAYLAAAIGEFRDRAGVGPKIPQFSKNLIAKENIPEHWNHPEHQATIDRWAMRTLLRLRNAVYGDTEIPLGSYQIKGNTWVGPEGKIVNTGEFFLGQEVFRRAAQKMQVSPRDLQALMWHAEQTAWKNMGLSDEGVGGSFADIHAKAQPQTRAYAGIAPANLLQAQDKPIREAQRHAYNFGRRIADMTNSDLPREARDGIQIVVGTDAVGLYGDTPELSVNAEIITKPGAGNRPIFEWAKLIFDRAKYHRQWDSFVAVYRPEPTETSRPGLELTFMNPLTIDEARAIANEIARETGMAGFTVYSDPRARQVQSSDEARYTGLRSLWMPEYMLKPDAAPEELAASRNEYLTGRAKVINWAEASPKVRHAFGGEYDVITAFSGRWKGSYDAQIRSLDMAARGMAEGAGEPRTWESPEESLRKRTGQLDPGEAYGDYEGLRADRGVAEAPESYAEQPALYALKASAPARRRISETVAVSGKEPGLLERVFARWVDKRSAVPAGTQIRFQALNSREIHGWVDMELYERAKSDPTILATLGLTKPEQLLDASVASMPSAMLADVSRTITGEVIENGKPVYEKGRTIVRDDPLQWGRDQLIAEIWSMIWRLRGPKRCFNGAAIN